MLHVAHGKTEPEPPAPLRMPRTIAETGIDGNRLLALIIKSMHISGLSKVSQLSEDIKLSRPVVMSLLEDASELSLVELMGLESLVGDSEMRYNLTAKGHNRASEALNQSQYVGPAPVPLKTFAAQVKNQNILDERVNEAELFESFSNLVLPEELIRRLGPAVNSGKSIFLYGTTGNGKTCIAEAIGAAFQEPIYIPYCLEVDGQIINLYDETVHHAVDPAHDDADLPSSNKIDQRWVRCRRPVVITGGELTLAMLDLSFNPISKFYEAPMQMKATGGVFVIDDFGRQQTNPMDILNRWIIPLERGKDYLTLHTGKQFPVPFNELVVFSTNMPPEELADEATLRRLYYKIEVPAPTRQDYTKIFENACRQLELTLEPDILPFIFDEFYSGTGIPWAGYHPMFLIQQVIAMCEYENIPRQIDKEHLRTAWKNLYAT